jgi:hypothetical protein
MSEEDFLSRWSRRKREVAAVEKAPEKTVANAAEKPVQQKENAPKSAVETPKNEVDLSALPPIESITSVTDVTAFLKAGVPADLTRAALRRVWTADPAIRNFVGLAENAWDFTDPAAIPGFGPLDMTDDVRQMIAQVIDQIGQNVQPAEPADGPEHPEVAGKSNDSKMIISREADNPGSQSSLAADDAQVESAQVLGTEVIVQSNIEDVAPQQDQAEAKGKPQQLSRRAHGGALPR